MPPTNLHTLMVDHLRDAHALDHSMHNVLGTILQTTRDHQMTGLYQAVREGIGRHEQEVQRRLEALGFKPSAMDEAGAALTSYVQGITVRLRSGKPAKNARDVYVLLQLEVAGYELLGRIAQRAGDDTTAALARRIGQENLALARRIGETWDHVIDLTLAQAGPPHDPHAGAGTAGGAGMSSAGSGQPPAASPGEHAATVGRSPAGDVDADLGMGLE